MNWLNAAAILLYLVSVLYLFRRFPRYLVLFGMVSALQTWALVSCAYNDSGIYNFELFQFTEPTLATARLSLFYLLFNVGFAAVAKWFDGRKLFRRDYQLNCSSLNLSNAKLLAYVAAMGLGTVLLYTLVINGIPLLQGIDRLAYLNAAGPLDRFLVGYGFILAFVLGLTRFKRGRFSVNGIVMFGFCMYAVMVGHKFSFLIELCVSYFAPIFACHIASCHAFTPFRKKYLAILGTAITVFLLFAFVGYKSELADVDGAGTLLMNRVLAGQGEVWWSIDGVVTNGSGYDDSHWEEEFTRLVAPERVDGDQVGMRYLMVKMLGPQKAHALFDRGYLFTMAYPAILIATFPLLVALILQIAAGGFFCMLLYYLHCCIIYSHLIRAVVALMIAMPFVTVLSTGNAFVFLSFGMVIKGLFVVVLETGLLANAGERIHDELSVAR